MCCIAKCRATNKSERPPPAAARLVNDISRSRKIGTMDSATPHVIAPGKRRPLPPVGHCMVIHIARLTLGPEELSPCFFTPREFGRRFFRRAIEMAIDHVVASGTIARGFGN